MAALFYSLIESAKPAVYVLSRASRDESLTNFYHGLLGLAVVGSRADWPPALFATFARSVLVRQRTDRNEALPGRARKR